MYSLLLFVLYITVVANCGFRSYTKLDRPFNGISVSLTEEVC